MDETDKRLAEIRERLEMCWFHKAGEDLRYLLAMVDDLRQQLVNHDAEANAACQNWDARCQKLETLIPDPKPLEWAANIIESYAQDWPNQTERAKAVATVSVFREWAAAIRDWREQEGDKEDAQ